jgi:RNA polymerase sigma factor (sigma-70 family)
MTEARPNPFVHHLRHLIGCVSDAALSDGQLLERFLDQRDETAVEVLVRRYGPLVLGVCRRVLREACAAEDVFQATFLVLVRKASSLDRGRPLGNWLYTVAYRLALRARASEQRRQRCEVQAASSRLAGDSSTSRSGDLVVALEEELLRLPERHRAALVLCYLEGKTHEQAADILGCPRGSMAARLDQARDRLRECLARRGFVAPSAGIAAALATAVTQAAVPLPLLDNTVRAAVWFAGEAGGAVSCVSSGAVALARKGLRGMVLGRLTAAGILLLAVALLGTGATMLLRAASPTAAIAEQTVLPVSLRLADGPGAVGDRKTNAALGYRQAFIALRRGLKPVGEKKLRDECLTMPLDADARQLVTKAGYALRMMHQGASHPGCDWAGGVERGIDLSFSHADGAGVLGSLACLRARLRFAEGKNAEAIDDLVAAQTLGRHVALDGTLDSLWASGDIQQRTGETLTVDLPRLDAKLIKDVKKRLDGLPAGGSVARATLRMEAELMSWIVGEIKEAKDRESLLAFLSQLCGGSSEPAEKREAKGRAFLTECGGTAKGVLESASQMHASFAPLARTLDLPSNRIEKEFDQAERKLAGNPVFKIFVPVLHKVRSRQSEAIVRRALLSAALAVQLDGADALKKHPDPMVGGLFDHVAFTGGFELRSKWKLPDGKPVSLIVGRRGK